MVLQRLILLVSFIASMFFAIVGLNEENIYNLLFAIWLILFVIMSSLGMKWDLELKRNE